MRLLLVFIFETVLFAHFLINCPLQVSASYQTAYNDYTFQLTKYREAHNAYVIAKSTYTTYRTLAAKEEAIAKLRTVLQSRAKLMATYFDLLYEKLLATPTVPAESRDTFLAVKENEKKWLAEHQDKLGAASTLEDLNDISREFENRHSQMNTKGKQIIGVILMSKINALSAKWDNNANTLQEQLKSIAAAGENITTAQTGMVTARHKRDLAQKRFDSAQQIFSQSDYEINLFSAQQKLIEGLQYLREATKYLQEIVRSFSG